MSLSFVIDFFRFTRLSRIQYSLRNLYLVPKVLLVVVILNCLLTILLFAAVPASPAREHPNEEAALFKKMEKVLRFLKDGDWRVTYIYLSGVARNSKWGEPQPPEARGSGGRSHSAGRFLTFFP